MADLWYRKAMKWLVAGIATLLMAIAVVVAVGALVAADPLYSVSQLDAGLRRHPAALVGHLVRVQGVVGFCPVRIGCPPNMPPILSPHLGPLSADPPLQLEYGSGDGGSLLATLRRVPLLGGLLPARAPLVDGYQGILHVRIEPVPVYACFERLCYEGVLQDKVRP